MERNPKAIYLSVMLLQYLWYGQQELEDSVIDLFERYIEDEGDTDWFGRGSLHIINMKLLSSSSSLYRYSVSNLRILGVFARKIGG